MGSMGARSAWWLSLGVLALACGHMREGSAPREIRSPNRAEGRVPQVHGTVAEVQPMQPAQVPAQEHVVRLRALQDIVGSAVSEERSRLAREMHDEIGPSLASLGLALDIAAMQQSIDDFARRDVTATTY